DSVAFYTPECIGLPNLHEISELNPFNLSAYGPLPNCLRLKTDVTICPPRLVTSEWLVLSRRESHPLYVTTYARSLQEPSCISSAGNYKIFVIEKVTELSCFEQVMVRFLFAIIIHCPSSSF